MNSFFVFSRSFFEVFIFLIALNCAGESLTGRFGLSVFGLKLENFPAVTETAVLSVTAFSKLSANEKGSLLNSLTSAWSILAIGHHLQK